MTAKIATTTFGLSLVVCNAGCSQGTSGTCRPDQANAPVTLTHSCEGVPTAHLAHFLDVDTLRFDITGSTGGRVRFSCDLWREGKNLHEGRPPGGVTCNSPPPISASLIYKLDADPPRMNLYGPDGMVAFATSDVAALNARASWMAPRLEVTAERSPCFALYLNRGGIEGPHPDTPPSEAAKNYDAAIIWYVQLLPPSD